MALSKGLTLVEVIIVIGIISILTSFSGFSLIRSRNVASLDSVTATVISDVRSQQLKSMSGNVQVGNQSPHYGIYFKTDGYVLFRTQNYEPTDVGNYEINLSADNQFSVINLPDNQIVFSDLNGEILNYDPVRNFITVSNINTGQQETLYFNPYGVVYETN